MVVTSTADAGRVVAPRATPQRIRWMGNLSARNKQSLLRLGDSIFVELMGEETFPERCESGRLPRRDPLSFMGFPQKRAHSLRTSPSPHATEERGAPLHAGCRPPFLKPRALGCLGADACATEPASNGNSGASSTEAASANGIAGRTSNGDNSRDVSTPQAPIGMSPTSAGCETIPLAPTNQRGTNSFPRPPHPKGERLWNLSEGEDLEGSGGGNQAHG